MKIIYLTLIIFISLTCSNIQEEKKNTIIENQTENILSKEDSIQKDDRLIGTWYVKEILINNEPDLENYPVNNDELTLNSDMTYITVEKLYNVEEKGSWARVSNNSFSINLDNENFVFQIIKLTNLQLETKILIEGMEMTIKYSREK